MQQDQQKATGAIRPRTQIGAWEYAPAAIIGNVMFNVTKKSIKWGEDTLTLETGKVARQADGSVVATLGETSVMANVTFAKTQKPGQDFFSPDRSLSREILCRG
jgi:hypothetical protein